MSFSDAVVVLSCLSAATCGLICRAGWRRRSLRVARGAAGGPSIPVSRRFELGRTPFSSQLVDVAEQVRTLLASALPIAARRGIHLKFAVQPGLEVRTDPRVFQTVLGDLLTHAVGQAPCGSVLVGARRHGGRVQVTVCDDGAGQKVAVQEAALRDTAQLLAMQGATLQIDARPGQGTTIAVRLPDAVDQAPPTPDTRPAQADAVAPWRAPADMREPATTRG